MAFPSSPTNGQQHTENGRTFQYNGSNAWQLVANNSLHASTHATGGSDAITPSSISAAPAASPTFTGVVTVAAGSVSSPSLTFSGDVNTGVYTPGADQIAVTCGGVQRLHANAAGEVGIGTAAVAARNVLIGKGLTGATAAFGLVQQGVVQSDVTAGGVGVYNILSTAAAAFTCPSYVHFQCQANALGANSAVTVQTGFLAGSTLTGAATNYGFRGQIAASSGRWNVFCDGTAQNYLAGNLGIGSGASTPTSPLDVAGDNIRVRTSKTPASATDTGSPGQWCWDGSYFYCCTAANTWRRTALAAW